MQNQYVKDCLAAISSVRNKVYAAMAKGDLNEATRLMGDLYALEVCLVIETEKLVRDMDYVLERMKLKKAA